MTIEAKVIADSKGPQHPRLTTLQIRYPRFIHAEFMTHRVFSRNASSSRAIPVQKQIDMIREDTARPYHWGKNQSGMQANEEQDNLVRVLETVCSTEGEELFPMAYSKEQAWDRARDLAITVAQGFLDAGYHKQIVNRILEPFSHISVVVTSTDFDNFFFLRRHKDAQPEIKILADMMYEAMEESTPRELGYNEWHLPYVTDQDRTYGEPYRCGHEQTDIDFAEITTEELIKVSVARCARVSYLTHDGQHPDINKDIALYDRLVGSTPLHASPAEHQAKPDELIWDEAGLKSYQNKHLHGNLTGYAQHRKMLPGENQATWEGLNVFD